MLAETEQYLEKLSIDCFVPSRPQTYCTRDDLMVGKAISAGLNLIVH